MIEQQIIIATLVHRYDFALPSDDWELDWEEAFLPGPSIEDLEKGCLSVLGEYMYFMRLWYF